MNWSTPIAIQSALLNLDLADLQYAHNEKNNNAELGEAFFEFCAQGKIDIAKWIYSLGCVTKDGIYHLMESTFEKVCKRGDITMAKWLYSLDDAYSVLTRKSKISFRYNAYGSFRFACQYGHEDIARWLHFVSRATFSLDRINIHIQNEYPFRWACRNGHYEIAVWLYSLAPNNINIHADNEYAFVWACRNGHSRVVAWLLSVGGDEINIAIDHDEAFRAACGNGHGEIAKLIYSFGRTDIHAKNNHAFRIACDYKHYEIVAWLLEVGIFNSGTKIDSAYIEKIIRFDVSNIRYVPKNLLPKYMKNSVYYM